MAIIRFLEFIHKRYQQRYQSLKDLDLYREMKTLGSGSYKLTSKMWILPNGEAKNIYMSPEGLNHWVWLQENPEIAAKFGVELFDGEWWHTVDSEEKAMGLEDDAFRAGFFRVAFEMQNGNLHISGMANKFHKKIKDAIFMLVLENSTKIRYFNIQLFKETGRTKSEFWDKVKNKSIPLFNYDDDQKLMALDGII